MLRIDLSALTPGLHARHARKAAGGVRAKLSWFKNRRPNSPLLGWRPAAKRLPLYCDAFLTDI